MSIENKTPRFSKEQINEVLAGLKNTKPDIASFEFPNIVINFAFKSRFPLTSDDTDFVEEIGPEVYRHFSDYIRRYTENSGFVSNKRQFEALSANYLETAFEILNTSKCNKLLPEFFELVDFVKSKQSLEGQGFTDYILARGKNLFSE